MGKAKTEGANKPSLIAVASAFAGRLSLTGAISTNKEVPTAEFCGASQARIEQSCWPGIRSESQLCLSF